MQYVLCDSQYTGTRQGGREGGRRCRQAEVDLRHLGAKMCVRNSSSDFKRSKSSDDSLCTSLTLIQVTTDYISVIMIILSVQYLHIIMTGKNIEIQSVVKISQVGTMAGPERVSMCVCVYDHVCTYAIMAA